MTNVLNQTDTYGDNLETEAAQEHVYFTAHGDVELDRLQVLELRDFLNTWLDGMYVSPDAGQPDAPGSVALEAHAAVYGDRQDDYGHPREDFTRTAVLWTGLLQHKLAEGEWIEAEDIGRCQIAVKLARDVHAPKRDNRVDIAGYALTLDRLETGR